MGTHRLALLLALAVAAATGAQDTAPPPLELALPAVALPDSARPLPGTGSVYFVGTATVILRLGNFTVLTDPNFLHKGELAQLGYGLSSPRQTDPALTIEQLPPIDLVLLSHYHGDHFDQVVEARLDKALPVLTTPHATAQLKERGFRAARALGTWQSIDVRKGTQRLRITAMPGRHGPPLVAAAMPQVMGSLVEWLGPQGQPLYRIYISGDTLVTDDLKQIPVRHPSIDLALLHLGGTRVFGVLVTMDAAQGVQALALLKPERAIPIHYDDYPVFKSPLVDFQAAVQRAGWQDKVAYLARGESYRFSAHTP